MNPTSKDYAGYAAGWIDYPTDSVEQGSVWHLDTDRAPFGRTLDKHLWRPLDNTTQAMDLAIMLDMSIKLTPGMIAVDAIYNGTVYCDVERIRPGVPKDVQLREAIFNVAVSIGKAKKGVTTA